MKFILSLQISHLREWQLEKPAHLEPRLQPKVVVEKLSNGNRNWDSILSEIFNRDSGKVCHSIVLPNAAGVHSTLMIRFTSTNYWKPIIQGNRNLQEFAKTKIE